MKNMSEKKKALKTNGPRSTKIPFYFNQTLHVLILEKNILVTIELG